MERFNLYFAGAIYPDRDLVQVRQALARTLKLDDDGIRKLFSGDKVLIRRGLNAEELARYEAAFKRAGAQVIVETMAEQGAGLTLEPKAPEPPKAEPEQADSPDPYGAPTTSVQDGQVFCRGCGQRIHPQAAQCPYCGAAQQVGSPRSKTVAGVLAILLGAMGTHRLYLGQWWGIFYLFVPFSSVVAVIEGIVFFASNEQRWNEKYGRVEHNLAWLIIPIFFVAIAVIGILAAVAIPAYHDYTTRAKVHTVLVATQDAKADVEAFVARTGILPDSNIMLGYQDDFELFEHATLNVDQEGRLVMTFSVDPISGNTLMLTAQLESGQVVGWRCGGGTLPARYRPGDCRNDLEDAESVSSPSASPYSTSQPLQRVSPENATFSVEIPGHWDRLHDLEDSPRKTAYGNKFREQYLMVLREPSVDYHDDADHRMIAEAFLDDTGAYIQSPRASALETITIAGLPASVFDLHGTIEGMNISYRGATFRGKYDVYFVLCWTFTERFNDFRGTCDQAIQSVRPGG